MKPFGGPYSSRVSQCFTFHIMSPCFHLSFTTCLPPPYLQLQPSCTSHVSGHSSLQPTGGWLMNLWPARLEWLEPNIAKWTSTKTGHGTIYIVSINSNWKTCVHPKQNGTCWSTERDTQLFPTRVPEPLAKSKSLVFFPSGICHRSNTLPPKQLPHFLLSPSRLLVFHAGVCLNWSKASLNNLTPATAQTWRISSSKSSLEQNACKNSGLLRAALKTKLWDS